MISKNNGDIGEFKGSTKQALSDIRSDISEIKTSVQNLATNFQALEAGRLSRLESELANIRGQALIVIALFTLIATAIANWLFRMIK